MSVRREKTTRRVTHDWKTSALQRGAEGKPGIANVQFKSFSARSFHDKREGEGVIL